MPFKKGYKMSEEHKRKIGATNALKMREKWNDPEYRKHMSGAHKGQQNRLNRFTSNGIGAVHTWLARHFTKECCQTCGVREKRLDFALKKGETYQHNRASFIVLCRSCHLKYDYTDMRREKLSKALKRRTVAWGEKIWRTRRKNKK